MKKQSLEAFGATEVVVSIVDKPTVPIVVHRGVYTLWEKPDGTLRIQYHRDDKDEEDFFELPGTMVRLVKKMQDGTMSPMDMMKEVTKMMMSVPKG